MVVYLIVVVQEGEEEWSVRDGTAGGFLQISQLQCVQFLLQD